MSLTVSLQHRQGDFTLDARFEAPAGVTVLFGRSGSGKTTVVNAVAGLIRPQAGRITVDGRVLFDSEAGVFLPPHRRRLGYVFQEGRLFPHLSVRQNVAFGLRRGWRNPPRGCRIAAVEHWLQAFGIDTIGDLLPAQISGGQRQRAALARAVMMSPDVILADEPTGNLDWEMSLRLLSLLVELNKMGKTILVATHDLNLIRAAKAQVSARVLRIAGNHLHQAGADL